MIKFVSKNLTLHDIQGILDDFKNSEWSKEFKIKFEDLEFVIEPRSFNYDYHASVYFRLGVYFGTLLYHEYDTLLKLENYVNDDEIHKLDDTP